MTTLSYAAASTSFTGNQSTDLTFTGQSSASFGLWGISSFTINSTNAYSQDLSLKITTNMPSTYPSGGWDITGDPVSFIVTPVWSPEIESGSTCTVSGLICTSSSAPSDAQLWTIYGMQNGVPQTTPLSLGNTPPLISVGWINGFAFNFASGTYDSLVSLGAGAGVANAPVTGASTGPSPTLLATSVLLGDSQGETTADATALVLTDALSGLDVQIQSFQFDNQTSLTLPASSTQTVTFNNLSSVSSVVLFIQSFYGQLTVANQEPQCQFGNPVLSVSTSSGTPSSNTVTVTVSMNMAAQIGSPSSSWPQGVSALSCTVLAIATGTPAAS